MLRPNWIYQVRILEMKRKEKKSLSSLLPCGQHSLGTLGGGVRVELWAYALWLQNQGQRLHRSSSVFQEAFRPAEQTCIPKTVYEGSPSFSWEVHLGLSKPTVAPKGTWLPLCS